MAFGNYLIKIGDYVLPLNKIEYGSYSAKVNVLDDDPYNDTDGILHRDVIIAIPIVQVTLQEMTSDEFDVIMGNISDNYVVSEERKALVSAWIPEWGRYESQYMYISDMDIKISHIDTKVHYESIELKFNSYGYGD